MINLLTIKDKNFSVFKRNQNKIHSLIKKIKSIWLAFNYVRILLLNTIF
ncbi:hypothetical protein MARI151_50130 [Maribacter litoralis]|uniref:Uncharacterized protein n=1 Tax=Maribacter litoralis TaxID=2059726 RepID=A0A653UIF7_9FLAO|nr:hypothetical protein MARI151_50130 [Maribacter litoralis]